MLTKINNFFKTPIRVVMLNGILISLAIITNSFIQVFCIPVTWAISALSITFITTIIYPLFKNNQLVSTILAFFNGLASSIYFYCILFLDEMNFVGLFLILLIFGIVTFVPHFLMIQLIITQLFKTKFKSVKIFFLFGIIGSVCALFLINNEYKKGVMLIDNFEQNNYQNLEKTYMTERILGMHLIYHTKFCEFDGWRPPKHDPILNIGLWLNDDIPLNEIDISTRFELYKTEFPVNTIKFECSCAKAYSDSYHNDLLWAEAEN